MMFVAAGIAWQMLKDVRGHGTNSTEGTLTSFSISSVCKCEDHLNRSSRAHASALSKHREMRLL